MRIGNGMTTRFLFALLMLLTGQALLATVSNPDAFGYRWKDSAEPDVSFNWLDITNFQDAVQITTLGDDDASSWIEMGFDFRYYWIDFDRIRIGSNGWLSFNSVSNISWCFPNLPTASGPQNLVAPLMSDLTFATNYQTFPNVGEVWHWTNAAQDSFVVSYIDVPWWKDDMGGATPPDWIGANTFQVIFTSVDSSITFQYKDLSQNDFLDRAQCGTDVVSGIENATGLIGLEVFADVMPVDSYAVKFFYPGKDTFEVRDASPIWNQNVENKARFVIAGDSLPLMASVGNVGNADITTSTVVQAKVRWGGNIRWDETDTLSTMNAGTNTVLNFDEKAVLQDIGQHFYIVNTSNSEDLNGTNDENVTEFAVIDGGEQFPALTYATGAPTNTSLSWPAGLSGLNGGGIYIDFPWYPFRILSVDVFIVGNDGNPNTPLTADFRMEIWEEDSMGNPATAIVSEFVDRNNALEDDWNNVVFSTQPIVDSGGFYIAWIQGGPGIGLGTETAGPKSRQTLEILSSQWNEYRFGATEDFLIKVNIDRNPSDRPERVEDLFGLTLLPNPSNGITRLQYALPKPGHVDIRLTDVLGREVWQSKAARQSPGHHSVTVNVAELGKGVYFVTLTSDSKRETVRLVKTD